MQRIIFIVFSLLFFSCNYETSISDIYVENKPLDIYTSVNDEIVIESIHYKNPFLFNLVNNDVVSIIEDSIYFSFDFDLHGFDCGAPDCYSTFVNFSFPNNKDSIVFPKTITIKEMTGGACLDSQAPKYYTFFLAEFSDKHLIFNSRGAKKSLVLNICEDEYENKAYYFSSINYPITLNNVEKLLIYDENTKECEVPFISTKLAYRI